MSPRYTAPDLLEDALERVEVRTDGQTQRGRLIGYEEKSGLAHVRLWLRRNQTADLREAQVLTDVDTATSWIGFDVIVNVPSGRPNQGPAFVIGVAQGQGIIYDSLSLPPDDIAVASDSILPSVDGWSATVEQHVAIDIPDPLRAKPLGALQVTAIHCAIDSVDNTVPVIRLRGNATGIEADYRAAPSMAARAEVVDWRSDPIPVVVFLPAAQPFKLQRVRGGRRSDLAFTATMLADSGGLRSGSVRGFLSSAAEDESRFDVPFKIVNPPRPLLCVKGRVSAFIP